MGYTIHFAIIVQLYSDEKNDIYSLAKEGFEESEGTVIAPKVLPLNGSCLMTIYSNGSKTNWPEEESWIISANSFMNELDKRSIRYVMVGFGGDQIHGEIMRDSKINKLPDWYPHYGLSRAEVRANEDQEEDQED